MSKKTDIGSPGAASYYLSERAWLEHLRIMGELPYPSWLLAPGIAKILRAHLDWDLIILAWDDKETLQPTDFWAEPIKGELFRRYMENLTNYVGEVPIRPLLETRGRIYRQLEVDPSYEQSALYKEFFEPYGVRWGVVAPIFLGEDGLAFLGLMRRQESGRYTDADQNRLDKVSAVLSSLDRRHNPLAGLPQPSLREAALASVLLYRDGRIVAETQEARNILFMARRTHLGLPEWTRADWHALPPEVAAQAGILFDDKSSAPAREVRLRLPWGTFDFLLEKVVFRAGEPETVVSVVVRHQEPLDITVARALWGWPLSPQEKRILVASSRNPSRADLAEALGLAEGTLRQYINELQNRMGVASRGELIEMILDKATLEEKGMSGVRA